MLLMIQQYGKTIYRHKGRYRTKLTPLALAEAGREARRLVEEGKLEKGYYEVILVSRRKELDADTRIV